MIINLQLLVVKKSSALHVCVIKLGENLIVTLPSLGL